MHNISLIILSAGNSTRFNNSVKKQWLRVDAEPLWKFVASKLSSYVEFKEIVITSSADELNYMKSYVNDFIVVEGGSSRQKSLNNALAQITTEYVLVTDMARSCISKELVNSLLNNINQYDCVVPYLKVSDTVVYKEETINRDDVKLIQTPQLSKTKILKEALKTSIDFTDDSSAIKHMSGKVKYILGEHEATKLTYFSDLSKLQCLNKPSTDTLIGSGFDVHEYENNKPMILGGVLIDVDYGLKAHSDGDVVIHALIDALLGGIGYGDIGELFPDNNSDYKNIDSKLLLKEVVDFVTKVGYIINNVDITIIAEKPRLIDHKKDIKKSLATLLKIELNRVNIKATTTEKLGYIGRKEGMASNATVSIKYYDWSN